MKFFLFCIPKERLIYIANAKIKPNCFILNINQALKYKELIRVLNIYDLYGCFTKCRNFSYLKLLRNDNLKPFH